MQATCVHFILLNNKMKLWRNGVNSWSTSCCITWQRPRDGIVVLNVDGSAVTNLGSVGFGGLVSNSAGEFLFWILWECGSLEHHACKGYGSSPLPLSSSLSLFSLLVRTKPNKRVWHLYHVQMPAWKRYNPHELVTTRGVHRFG